jgi:hypothetical protein
MLAWRKWRSGGAGSWRRSSGGKSAGEESHRSPHQRQYAAQRHKLAGSVMAAAKAHRCKTQLSGVTAGMRNGVVISNIGVVSISK